MILPDGIRIECAQRGQPRLHVRKPAHPYEAVWVVEIAERAEHMAAKLLLAFDETSFEQLDQHIALARMERVVAQLKHSEVLHAGPPLSRTREMHDPVHFPRRAGVG